MVIVTHDLIEVAENIKTLRKAAGLTQKELADAMGLGNVASVSLWETGKRSLSVHRMQKIIEVCGGNASVTIELNK